MRNRDSRKYAGFTLVELLVVLAVTGIITAGLFNFMISQSRSYTIQEDRQEMEQNARIAMEILANDIRKADINLLTNTAGSNNISIEYDNGSKHYHRIYNLVNGVKNTEQDEFCQRLSYKIGPNDSDYTGNNDNVGSISFFLNNFGYGDVADVDIFKVEPSGSDNKLVTITLKFRSRKSDPRYPDNNGYRQMELNRQVFVRGS